jgi:polyisoprenoid-binding protein YceI
VVNVASLKSDRDRRDGYVRGRVLETDQYPTVEFTPTGFRGLPKTLPTSGSHKFDVIGNLTVHGVTKPTIWHVTAEARNGQVTGSAFTLFTFPDFNMTQPRVPIVLSVADTIRLEYDFNLVEKK